MAFYAPLPWQRQLLLQTVWDLACGILHWPTFAELDRSLYTRHEIQALDVLREMPAGFLYGIGPTSPMPPTESQEIGLTVAGVEKCQNTSEILAVFIEFMQMATRTEKGWVPPPGQPDALPSLTEAEFASHASTLPAAGRDHILRLLFLILKTERMGWGGCSADGAGHWTISFTREIRRFKNVTNLSNYWAERSKPWESQRVVHVHVPATTDNTTRQPTWTGHLNRGTSQMNPTTGIFLSHAHADRPLADLLRNTLLLGGVPERHIFYSSSRATGIPSGEGVRPYLQRSLQQAGLVIELVSETFLRSPWCLMELGGAWALGTSTHPVVVPPLTRDLVVQQIGDVQMGFLGTESDLDDLFDELHDRLAKDVGIQTDTTPWNRAIRDFKRELPSKLAMVRAASTSTTGRAPSTSRSTPGRVTTTPEGAEKITLNNISIASGRRGQELHGEATNNDDIQRTVWIQATFYNVEGQIIGTETAVVTQLSPTDTKTFSIRPVPDHHHFKVQISMTN
ncbi:MAG: TIR domain-containing protein [Terriglobales bacterium]